MTLLHYERRKAVGFKELSWLLRIIVTTASDYDDDNDSDIGISFSIQYLDWQLLWQWDLLTEPIDVAVHTWQWHWLCWILTVGIWMIIFPWLIFLDGSKTRKLQTVWLSYGIISGNLASSGINFLNPNSLSQKATKMSKKSSVALLLWQSLSSSVLCLILWNLF